ERPPRAGRLLPPAVELRLPAAPAPHLAFGGGAQDLVRRGVSRRRGHRGATSVRRGQRAGAARLARGARSAATGRLRRLGGRGLPGRHRSAPGLPPRPDGVDVHPDGPAADREAGPLSPGLRLHGRPGVVRVRSAHDARQPGSAAGRERPRLHRRAHDSRRREGPRRLSGPPLPVRSRARALRGGAHAAPRSQSSRRRLRRGHRRAHRPRHRRGAGRAAARLGHPDGRPRLQGLARGPAPGPEPALPRYAALRAAPGDHGRLRRRTDALRAQRGHTFDQPHQDPGVPRGRPPGDLHARRGRRGRLPRGRRLRRRRRGVRDGLRQGASGPPGRPGDPGGTAAEAPPLGHDRRPDAGAQGRGARHRGRGRRGGRGDGAVV
ncbi:MAG: hypothetical protein AVDCRST_MAG53-976, partial [uncultured Solirubrobacteraceae bacterium]